MIQCTQGDLEFGKLKITPRKIRILHLTHEMDIGGTQQVIRQLVTNLDRNRFDCDIGCIDGEIGLLGEKLLSDGIKFHVFNRNGGFDIDLIKEIRTRLKVEKYDVLHCHQYTPFVYGIFASLFIGVRVVFTEHGRFYPDRFSWKRRMLNPLLGYMTDSIVAISAATRRSLSTYEWFSEKHIHVIYNGLEPAPMNGEPGSWRERLGIPDGLLVYGTIARFDPIKNIAMMIIAFSEVHLTNSKTRLLLVGDGTERPKLEKMVRTLGIEDAVIFTGFQTDTSSLMSLIDIYLLSSFSEGTSMTLLEAMSSGTCSIVTRVGGNSELIEHEKTGVIVESEDSAAMASWMAVLANDPAMRKSLSDEACRVFGQRFSIKRMVEGYSRTYEAVLRLS